MLTTYDIVPNDQAQDHPFFRPNLTQLYLLVKLADHMSLLADKSCEIFYFLFTKSHTYRIEF